jgi:hypothetical protein
MRTSTVAAFFTMSNSPARSRGALLRPGFASLLRSPQSRGGRSAERRSGACEAPVGHAVTRHVRRLRGALRPMTRDARLSALHRGGFGLPGPRFSPRYRPRLALRPAADRFTASSSQPGRSAWRAASLPPEATVTSRRRETPLPAPPSGCLRRRPSMSEDANLVAWMLYVVNSVVEM